MMNDGRPPAYCTPVKFATLIFLTRRDALAAELDAGLAGEHSGEFLTAPLRMAGAVLEGGLDRRADRGGALARRSLRVGEFLSRFTAEGASGAVTMYHARSLPCKTLFPDLNRSHLMLPMNDRSHPSSSAVQD